MKLAANKKLPGFLPARHEKGWHPTKVPASIFPDKH